MIDADYYAGEAAMRYVDAYAYSACHAIYINIHYASFFGYFDISRYAPISAPAIIIRPILRDATAIFAISARRYYRRAASRHDIQLCADIGAITPSMLAPRCFPFPASPAFDD